MTTRERLILIVGITIVLWAGTLAMLMPLIVSFVWTLVAIYLLARTRRSVSH